MAQNDFKPVSWNGEAVTNSKLNQMSNNTQYLFERQPKIRFTGTGNNIIRDSALKMIVGKTPYPLVTTANYIYMNIMFGSFFTAGCKPIVIATVEGGNHRAKVVTRNLTAQNVEIDQNGFIAIVSHEEQLLGGTTQLVPGWVHWTAYGY